MAARLLPDELCAALSVAGMAMSPIAGMRIFHRHNENCLLGLVWRALPHSGGAVYAVRHGRGAWPSALGFVATFLTWGRMLERVRRRIGVRLCESLPPPHLLASAAESMSPSRSIEMSTTIYSLQVCVSD
jgi:hypothetical protein